MTNARTIHASHNGLGLRDEEFVFDGQPTIMVLGDSFVWGLDAEANERFSELLKPRITGYKSLTAGVSGYGTDQEYLLLKKIWSKVKPAVVVLIFCTDNDREDKSTNIRYEGYQKPYFATAADGSLVLHAQPVPDHACKPSRRIGGCAILVSSACERRLSEGSPPYAARAGPDRAAGRQDQGIRGANGAKFLVGVQTADARLVRHLETKHISFVTFDGPEAYPGAAGGGRWTPEGHRFVAEQLFGLLSANHLIGNEPRASDVGGCGREPNLRSEPSRSVPGRAFVTHTRVGRISAGAVAGHYHNNTIAITGADQLRTRSNAEPIDAVLMSAASTKRTIAAATIDVLLCGVTSCGSADTSVLTHLGSRP